MKEYLHVLKQIYEEGHDHPDRTGTGRRSIFGIQLRFNMRDGFPLVTTRKTHYKAAFKELFWFIHGSNNAKALREMGVKIWDSWAVSEKHIDDFLANIDLDIKDAEQYRETKAHIKEYLMAQYDGSIGPMYGNIWRFAPVSQNYAERLITRINPGFDEIASDKLEEFKKIYDQEKPVHPETNEPISFEEMAIGLNSLYVDQLQELIVGLKKDPYSARHVMSAWIPEFVPRPGVSPQENVLTGRGTLAACHVLVQCFVSPGDAEGDPLKLSLQLYQRSADFPVSSVFNIAQYALLLHLLAHVCDMEPYEFIYTLGDTHIYQNQLDGVKEQLTREPLPRAKLVINTEEKDLFKIQFSDIGIEGYEYLPDIQYPISI